MPTAVCPNPVTLRAFDRGDLPEALLVATADHLGACARCQAALAAGAPETAADPLLRGLRTLAAPVNELSAASSAGTKTWVRPSLGGSESTAFVVSGPPPSAAPPPAATFGHYVLGEQLGEGGMGVVYKAVDTHLKRTVALKMIHAGRGVPGEAVARFIAEAEAVARLQHPNVVQIHELGDVAGQPYAALEFVAGGSLDRRLRTTLPDPRVAARLMIPVARGVQAAHDLNLVHRDLKPANILLHGPAGAPLDACVPKVTDFGLVKFLDAAASAQTQADAVMGTPSYMAPEQAAGKAGDVGKPADVYALGATLYDLLSGRPPFKGTTIQDTLRQVVEQDPVPPRSLQPQVPPDLETICLTCLEKDPARRYASPAAVAEDLQRFLNGEPISARPVGRVERAWRWAKRKPALAEAAALSAAAGLVLLAGAFWATYRVADESGKAKVAEATANQEIQQRAAADRLQRANEYHARLARTRERLVTRETGWTRAAAADVREAAAIDTDARDPAALRSAYATALAGVDVHETGVLAKGFPASVPCYAPDGRWLALAQCRAAVSLLRLEVRLIDPVTGATMRSFSYPVHLVGPLNDLRPDKPRSLAVSSDGRWLAVGTRSGRVHRWDLSQADPACQTIQPAKGGKECEWLAFAPDNAALYVMTFGPGGGLSRWETAGWTQTAHHPTASGALAVHPLGAAVYVQGPGRTVLELDPVTLAEQAAFAKGAATVLAVSPDGATLAVGADRSLTLWDTASRTPAATLREPNRETAYDNDANSLAFSPDGRFLAAVDEFSRHVYLYDVVTGERVADWRGNEGLLRAAFDPQSQRLVVGDRTGTTVLAVGGGRECRAVAVRPLPVIAAGLSPDGERLGVVHEHLWGDRKLATATVWAADGRGPSRPAATDPNALGHRDATRGRVDFRGGRTAFAAGHGLHVADGGPAGGWPLDNGHVDGLFTAALGPGDRVWLTAGRTVQARPVRGQTAAAATHTNPSAQITGLGELHALAVGEQWAVVGGLDGTLRLFPAAVPAGATELKMTRFKEIEPRAGIDAVALAADESVAVVGTRSGKGYVVAVPDLTVLAAWPAHADDVTAAVALGSGLFATGGKDSAVRFWQVAGGAVTEVWSVRLRAAVTSLGASADGRRLCVTAAWERGVHVWDLAEVRRRFADAGLDIAAPP